MDLLWQWKVFEELSLAELYAVLKVRQEVFVIEQNCIYQDVDDLDQHGWHLLVWNNDTSNKQLLAYLRVVFPGYKYKEASIGRVLTTNKVRATGLGKQLMSNALSKISQQFPKQPIRISAQQQLHNFYSKFGFEQVSEPYDEDGIMHIDMLKL